MINKQTSDSRAGGRGAEKSAKVVATKKDGDKQLGKRILKFIGVGLACTAVDYAVYAFCVMVLFGGNTDMAGVGTVISGTVATFAAFILHSKITWRTRNPGKLGIVKFFLWNAFVVIAVRPVLALFFGLFGGLYEFGFMIFGGLGMTYEFVESTGIFGLVLAVTMVLNYVFYDRIVFGQGGGQQNS